ncbi:MAG: type I 3-dehydroquinate dehydratase [Synergistaceae bacterium]|jgi:3-dehydroquinate dehydratase-1|nr:type I 3-dehydroquinate dehydratase [Synergistaceae bacterium]
MRPVPQKPIRARRSFETREGEGPLLGGAVPLICVPLVGKSRDDVLAETRNLAGLAPDVVELRIDAWDCIENVVEATGLISEVRDRVEALPVILTCRGHWEGGVKEVSEAAKDAIYEAAMEGGLVDFVDKELKYGETVLARLKERANARGVRVIVSYHDFRGTPSKEFIYSRLAQQIRYGADVAKAAFMPQKEEDVLNVLSATLAIRREFPDVPLITMSMGELGMHSRVVGGLYGSDLTFAVGSAASAPGQIPVAQMRSAFDLMYPGGVEAPNLI